MTPAACSTDELDWNCRTRDVDERRKETVLMIELAGDAFPDRPQILRDKHALIVLRQIMQLEKILLAGGDAPAHEKVAQPDKEDDVHEVLNGEGIDEMLRRFVENEDSGAAGKNEREEDDEDDAGGGREQDGARAPAASPRACLTPLPPLPMPHQIHFSNSLRMLLECSKSGEARDSILCGQEQSNGITDPGYNDSGLLRWTLCRSVEVDERTCC